MTQRAKLLSALPPRTLRMLCWGGLGFAAFAALVLVFLVVARSTGGGPPPRLPDSQEGQVRAPVPTPPTAAPQITISQTRIELAPRAGNADRRSTVLRASGGPVQVGPLRTPSRAMNFEGDCLQLRGMLAAGESCTLTIASDSTSAVETMVAIDHGPALPASELAIEIRPQLETTPPTLQVAREPSVAERLAAWQLARQGATPNVLSPRLSNEAPVDGSNKGVRSEPRYNAAFHDRAIPSARFTRPVDRSRIVTQDRIIKAVLQTPIASNAPGRVIALVARPVRSSDGDTILVQAGTAVLGVGGGDSARAGIVWQRMITPDGASVTLEGAIAADKMGRAGLPGELYTQFWARFGQALATSVVNFTASFVVAGNDPVTVTDGVLGNSRQETPRQEAARQLRRDMADITRQLAAEGARLQPVLIVAGGTELDIVLGQDLYIPRENEIELVADGIQPPLNPAGSPARGGSAAIPSTFDPSRGVADLPIRVLPTYEPGPRARDLLATGP